MDNDGNNRPIDKGKRPADPAPTEEERSRRGFGPPSSEAHGGAPNDSNDYERREHERRQLDRDELIRNTD
jgi:hypothetical protein